MRNQDLVLAARKCRVVTAFRNTIGLPGTMSVRLQPNHPTDDPRGIALLVYWGLALGAGDDFRPHRLECDALRTLPRHDDAGRGMPAWSAGLGAGRRGDGPGRVRTDSRRER